MNTESLPLKNDTMRLCIFFFFTSFFFFACQKDENVAIPKPSPHFWGEATARQNGIPWRGDPVCRYDVIDRTTLFIQLDSFAPRWTEVLSFWEIPPVVGTYEVFGSTGTNDGKANASFYYLGYDVLLAGYRPLEGGNNRFVLESIDTTSKEIKGSFDLTLVISQRPYYPDAPDTIRFTNGKFHGRLYK